MPKSGTPLSSEERRARRAARREAQRAANVGRAHKMHLARIADASPEPPEPGVELPKFNVGCSGWFYWHWRGGFYPQEMPTGEWFGRYSDHFRTVELNAPFYSWPTVAAVKTWARQAGAKDFVYTVKVCELITHVKRFVRTKTLVRDFGYIARLLGKRMGCFLFQLPPSYHYTPARLKSIVSQCDPCHRNVVEFRHRSWWNPRVYDAFTESGIIFCSCSGPRLPDELVKTSAEIYLRLHGTSKWYRHDYTEDELQVWADRILRSGAERAWIYFNNDRDGYAIKNSQHLLKILHSSSRSNPIKKL
jgi:uncharacterized protein YecE (DUF72 family)